MNGALKKGLILIFLAALFCVFYFYRVNNDVETFYKTEKARDKIVYYGDNNENKGKKQAAEIKDPVVFNPKTLKFHEKNCEWVKKCKRCILISRKEALNKNAVPCRMCQKH